MVVTRGWGWWKRGDFLKVEWWLPHVGRKGSWEVPVGQGQCECS